MGGFPRLGVPFGGPIKDYGILGSILETPFWEITMYIYGRGGGVPRIRGSIGVRKGEWKRKWKLLLRV